MAELLKIRGQETKVTMTVEGVEFKFQVESFSHKPRMEITEHDFLNEDSTELDQTFSGHDFSWEMPRVNADAVRYVQLCQDRQDNGQPPPRCMVAVEERYRQAGLKANTRIFINALVMITNLDTKGRKEYSMASAEGKSRKMKVL